MAAFSDWEHLEYQALMQRGRDAERVSLLCWTAGGISAAVLLSWGIAAKSASLMVPVVFATAFGFYAAIHGRSQVRLIAGYIKEFIEDNSSPQWFTRLSQLEVVPGFNPAGDWAVAALANVTVVAAIAFSWIYASGASAGSRGDLMAGITTGLGLVFCFHSITETARIRATNAGALWGQIAGSIQERRGPRLAARG